MSNLVQQIDELLPQTQCTKCGFDGCLPYAAAIANDDAPINRCPPGGDAGIAKLSQLLNRPALPLDTACGEYLPHRVAFIDEAMCIGCVKCLNACPVDAIVGANKFMHTIITERCTGCELCIPPCPVDCITMVAHKKFPLLPAADTSRTRYQQHMQRLIRNATERNAALAAHEQQLQNTQ